MDSDKGSSEYDQNILPISIKNCCKLVENQIWVQFKKFCEFFMIIKGSEANYETIDSKMDKYCGKNRSWKF